MAWRREQQQDLTDDVFFAVFFGAELGLLVNLLRVLLDTPLFICSHMASTWDFISSKTWIMWCEQVYSQQKKLISTTDTIITNDKQKFQHAYWSQNLTSIILFCFQTWPYDRFFDRLSRTRIEGIWNIKTKLWFKAATPFYTHTRKNWTIYNDKTTSKTHDHRLS